MQRPSIVLALLAALVLLLSPPSAFGAQERLGDPGFELSTPNGSFPTSGWWQRAWLGEAGAVCTTTAGRSGNGLWAYTGTPGASWWSGTYQQFSVTEGLIYEVSAWLRTPFGYPWVAGSRALVRFLFLTSTGAVIATYETAPLTEANSGWRPFSVNTPPAPAGAAWGRIILYLEKPAGTVGQGVVNFDDASVVEVVPPPTITVPPSSQTVPEGTDVTFRVAATGIGPFAYGWQFAGADIPGANTDTLTLPAVTLAQAGLYSVRVGNAGGFSPSADATLTVVPVTHPVLQSVSPLPNLVNATRNVVVSATFDQPLDPSSAAGLVVHSARQGRLLAPPGSLSVAGATVSLACPSAFAPGDLLQASLTRQLRSASGGALDTPFVWQFRTAAARAAGLFVDSGQRFGSVPLQAGLFLRSMALGDLDGDEDLDLFGVFLDIGSFATELRVWFNEGGQLQDSDQVLRAFGGEQVKLADFDNDGDLDAFISHMWGCNLWRNDGTGRFDDSVQPLAIDFAAGAGVGDFDGDGDVDIYLACSGGQSPSPDHVLFNNGHGVFTDSGQLLGSSYSSGAAVSDLDQDGDLDVVVACTKPADRVWINDGSGGFTASSQAVGGIRASAVVAADFNGDGKADVALLTGSNSYVIEVWLNEGQARFHATGQALGFEGNFTSLSTGDFDGDGRLDLFTTDSWHGQNRLWLGRGDGTFFTRAQRVGPTVGLGAGPRAAGVGDLDGDGDLDVCLGFESDPLQGWMNANSRPTLSLTVVPPFGSTLNLAGRVEDLDNPSAYGIATVIFIPGLGYYSKPYCTAQIVPLNPDGTFSIDITTGGVDDTATRVICWLVSPDVVLPCLTGADCIPEAFDESSWAQATAEHADPSQRVIGFGGYTWLVKTNRVPLGPGPNHYAAGTDNVWLDAEGRLHLRITYRNGAWYCAEVIGQTPLGYGDYTVAVDSPLLLDPNVVFAMFTWSDDCPHRELDLEASRWGNPAADNLQFVVQPFDLPGHLYRFSGGETESTTHTLTWRPGRAHFRSVRGAGPTAPNPPDVLAEWELVDATGVPQPGNATPRFNLWLFNGAAPTDGQEVEVIIRSFRYQPPQPTAAGLDYFRAVAASPGQVKVTWRILVEFDTLGYRLFKKVDDSDWVAVGAGLIPSRGQGQTPQTYELIDPAPPSAGDPMYRLIAVDLRGTERVLAEAPVSVAEETTRIEVERSGAGLRLMVVGQPGAAVHIERSDALGGGWTRLGCVQLDASGRGILAESLSAEAPTRFYRALTE